MFLVSSRLDFFVVSQGLASRDTDVGPLYAAPMSPRAAVSMQLHGALWPFLFMHAGGLPDGGTGW